MKTFFDLNLVFSQHLLHQQQKLPLLKNLPQLFIITILLLKFNEKRIFPHFFHHYTLSFFMS